MGIAAYNRGTAALTRSIEQEFGSEKERHNREVIERINNFPKGKLKPFGPVRIEFDKQRKMWWLMPDTKDRYSRFSWVYADLKSLMNEWSIVVVGYAKDEHGYFYRADALS